MCSNRYFVHLGVVLIFGIDYKTSVGCEMIKEVHASFIEKFGLPSLSANENGLNNRSCLKILKEACTKYEDSAKVDKVSQLMDKVEQIQGQMQDNVANMIENTESAQSLKDKSDELNNQAALFKGDATKLQRTMKWRNIKTTLILVGAVILVLVIILVPLIINTSAADN